MDADSMQGRLCRLDDALRRAGVDTGAWRLRTALAITPDGLTVAGDGINPAGQYEAYLAVLPQPPPRLSRCSLPAPP